MERQRFVEGLHDCHEMVEADFEQMEQAPLLEDIDKHTQLDDEEDSAQDVSSSDEEVQAVIYD